MATSLTTQSARMPPVRTPGNPVQCWSRNRTAPPIGGGQGERRLHPLRGIHSEIEAVRISRESCRPHHHEGAQYRPRGKSCATPSSLRNGPYSLPLRRRNVPAVRSASSSLSWNREEGRVEREKDPGGAAGIPVREPGDGPPDGRQGAWRPDGGPHGADYPVSGPRALPPAAHHAAVRVAGWMSSRGIAEMPVRLSRGVGTIGLSGIRQRGSAGGVPSWDAGGRSHR